MIIAAGVNNTDGKFATQRHQRQICHQYSKFATGVTVSLTNNGNTFRLPTPYSELEEKIQLYIDSTTQPC